MRTDLLACYRDLKKGSSQTEREGMRPDSSSRRAFDGLKKEPSMLIFVIVLILFLLISSFALKVVICSQFKNVKS